MDPTPRGMLGHYRLAEILGQGGMGTVYRAFDTRLKRHVALKLLRPRDEPDEDARRRFYSEARTAASISHPAIATIHEIGEADGQTFIVMELIEGMTLNERLASAGAIPLEETLDIAIQFAEGLAEAHARGVVHRDLKPQNVMIDHRGHVKILDFGLACFQARPQGTQGTQGTSDVATNSMAGPEPGGLAGTIAYMSPEQLLGEGLSASSDLFAFGTLLYETVTGKHPFIRESPTATIARILEASPEPPRDIIRDLPGNLETLIRGLLAKQPVDRPANAGVVAAALIAVRDGSRDGARLSPTTVAIFPFAFRGAETDSYLGEGLVDLLSSKLNGAGDLRSVDPHALLASRDARADRISDPAQAAGQARRHDAGLFVLGHLLEASGRLHLDASLYESDRPGQPVATSVVQGEAATIFDMVDRLASELLAARQTGPGGRLTRIAATTTASFAALKAYLEGEREMRSMHRQTAVEAYRRAVEADPSFALAWYRLAVAALWSRQPEMAWAAAEEAVKRADRLTQRDRSLLDAFHALLRGECLRAEALYRSIVGTHPDDVEAWYQLGEILHHFGPQRGRPARDAKPVWERLLRIDPGHLPALVHLGVLAAGAGDLNEVEALTARVMALSPEADSALWMRAMGAFGRKDEEAQSAVVSDLGRASDHAVSWAARVVGVFLGEISAGSRIAALLTEPLRSGPVRAHGHILRAWLAAARGRWRKAMEEIESARLHDPIYALEHRALLVASPFLPIRRDEIASALETVSTWSPPPAATPIQRSLWLDPHEGIHALLRTYLIGLLSARLGDAETARRCAREMPVERNCRTICAPVEALARNLLVHAAIASDAPEEALSVLEGAEAETNFYVSLWSPFFSLDHERLLRAELLRQSGRHVEAIEWYNSFAENSIYDLVFMAPSDFRRGEIHRALGRHREAAAHFRRFVRFWKRADEEFQPLVTEAAAMLSEMGERGPD